MAKVLFITEKYHSGPGYGLTNNIYNLIGSYECAGLGTYEHCFIDPENIWSSQGVDQALLNHSWDLAVISVYHHLPSIPVAQRLGRKIVMCWWDAIVSMPGIQHWSNYIHQLCFDWGKGQELPNIFCVEVPQDTRLLYRDDTPEDIDISFIGSIDAPRSDRARTIQILKDAGFNVWAAGGRGPGLSNFSMEEYCSIFRRSKICLNLQYGHGRPQRKGRTFEIAACGKFMMANCPETYHGKEGAWFEDGVDFASFNDNDLVEKTRYFLERHDERKVMADRLYNKYINNYSPQHFWRKIHQICEVEV